MHRAQSAADRESSLGEEGTDGLKQVGALNPAVQVHEDFVDKARLVAEIQDCLRVREPTSSQQELSALCACEMCMSLLIIASMMLQKLL